jgi:formylglycine-generating enzyme required for sulfatase activity
MPAACRAQNCTTNVSAEIQQQMRVGTKEIIFYVGTARFTLVRLPPGEFDLGVPQSEANAGDAERPVRHIRITKPFYLGTTEVSQRQYREVMKGRHIRDELFFSGTPAEPQIQHREVIGEHLTSFQGDDLPVEGLTFVQTRRFCDTLSEKIGVSVSLPTEAQWEYACRAGTKTPYYSGDKIEDLNAIAWFEKNSNDATHPVGLKAPNRWGLYDMLGNVWEPCSDRLSNYDSIADTDPVGEVSPVIGMMRGGCWHDDPEHCRAASRMLAHDSYGGMGLRIAIQLP